MIPRLIIFLLLCIYLAYPVEAQEKKDTLTQQKIDSLTPQQVDTLIKKTDTLIITKGPQNLAPTGSFMGAYAKSYWTDTKSVFTNPFHWKPGQIITAAAITAGTISLILWGDKPIQQFFYRNESTFISNSSYYFFSPLGTGLISIPTLGVFFACGVIWKNKKAKRDGVKGVGSLCYYSGLHQRY